MHGFVCQAVLFFHDFFIFKYFPGTYTKIKYIPGFPGRVRALAAQCVLIKILRPVLKKHPAQVHMGLNTC